MKQSSNILFSIALLSSIWISSINAGNSCCTQNSGTTICNGQPFLQLRSQGRDSTRELVGWQQFINKDDQCLTYGAFSMAVEYERSFREERIAHELFGSDLVRCCQLYIQGSAVTDRNTKAWLADYFGLPTDYDSRVTFNPTVQNTIIDLNFYVGLDQLKPGLFVRINAPFVWSKWELNPCEQIIARGENGFAAGYMAEGTIARNSLAKNFLQAMHGGYTFGDMKLPMKFGKINSCDNTTVRFAEIDLAFGYNFLLEDEYHLGIFIHAAAPTGNRPKAAKLFEPMIGNGKHWEIGGGFTGSWIFWNNDECEDSQLGLWYELTLSHLFKACQCRSFDLCCKPNSRYMLLEEMSTNNDALQSETDNTVAEYQYRKNLIPAIDWSTLNVDVRIAVQADFAIKLGWMCGNWSCDLGYNLWARTGERFLCADFSCATNKTYAIKGDAFIYGQEAPDGTAIYPLSATQCLADIHSGKNFPAVDVDNPASNPRIDNPQPAEVVVSTVEVPLFIPGTDVEINTSIQPSTLSSTQINICKSPAAITHKIFAHVNYAWKDRCEDSTNIPFIGIGGKAEFAQSNYNQCCKGKRKCCSNFAGISFWGVWIKGGVAFD